MDYTAILQALNKASLFDLHRLQSAIYQELINPDRVEQVKAQLKIGQAISYFDPQANGLIDAVILKIQKTRCLVRNVKDQKNWNIPFYYINLDDVDTAIQPAPNACGIPKTALHIGAKVGFKDRNNQERFGEVIRLNPKTATLRLNDQQTWLVGYNYLFYVIDSAAHETQPVQELLFIDQDG
ncbi:hypothetical protein GO003_008420 [Methylicorpusculum oleiharenae]|uniref:hypothetical protein n=1 Tax=Methylicorpusculum oleiharenae TaxID=1338687 RepID=UPI00135AAD5A|nr:hypothetical protein [Methylicorpusculum oleiharenae]MCD2450410.1 hypothetical protein [Methylicorpusculum oleiharenae]